MEDTAANLTGDSKGAEQRRGGSPTALRRRIELGRAALVGDDERHRRRSGTAELGTDSAMGRRSSGGGGRRRSGTAAAATRRRNGSRGRRRHDADQENHQVLGKGEEEGRYRGGGLLSRVEPRPGTKGPFVPGGGFTRDKRPPLLSRMKPPPGTKDPFIPGRGFTRDKRVGAFCPGRGSTPDKRCFWAGRENSQPAAHL